MTTVNVIDQVFGTNWALYCGDCIQTMAGLPDNSIDLSVYSPPFASLYIYSNSEADMGNAASTDEFLDHYAYALRELYRITLPGRLTVVHVKDLPLYKNSSGWFGIEPFSDFVVSLHRDAGWMMHSRITIWKDPVVEQEKTNSHGLLHRNFWQRSQVCRTGLPDYLLVFVKPDPESMGRDVMQLRKPGDYIGTLPPQPHELLAARPLPPDYPGSLETYNYSIAVWQRYASPVWFDIDQQRVAPSYRKGRSEDDEKHLCPLQLDVIERAIDLWSNEGETVFTPFAGIGSEVMSAVRLGRRGVGVELKPEYWRVAVNNVTDVETQMSQISLLAEAVNE
jgi:DNA modification methylase